MMQAITQPDGCQTFLGLTLCCATSNHCRQPYIFQSRQFRQQKITLKNETHFFRPADAFPRTTCRYKARVLRISLFLILDVPAPPRCRAASFYQHRMRRKGKRFRCERCPSRSRARLQFAGGPSETICKYRGRSVAVAARASISRESVVMQGRDRKCCGRNIRNKKPPSKLFAAAL